MILGLGLGAPFSSTAILDAIRALFSSNEQGAAYDPSDMSTLFQDSAGTVPVTAIEQPVGRILDKSGRGNHASQTTTTKRPVLSRRVNLLTKTEKFDDAGWVRSSGVTVETGHVDPLGGATGCLVTIPAGGQIYILSADTGGSAVASVYLRLFAGAATATVSVNSPNGQGYSVSFDSASLQGAWSRLISVPSNTAVKNGFRFLNGSASEAKFYAWGASFTLAADAHLPYQRVNTATDYDADPNKFPAYLRFDGVDDALQTGNIDFTGTDKMTGWAGITRFGSATGQEICGLTPSPVNGGAFTLWGSTGSEYGVSNDQLAASSSISRGFDVAFDFMPDGSSTLLTGHQDASGLTARLNGVATTIPSVPVRTFANSNIYIGSRGGSYNFLKGRLYSLIIRGAQSNLSQIEATEAYIKQKMRLP